MIKIFDKAHKRIKKMARKKPIVAYGDYICTAENKSLKTAILMLSQAKATLEAIEEEGSADSIESFELVFDKDQIGWIAGVISKD